MLQKNVGINVTQIHIRMNDILRRLQHCFAFKPHI